MLDGHMFSFSPKSFSLGERSWGRLPRQLRTAVAISAMAVIFCVIVANTTADPAATWLTTRFFRTQDAYWLVVVAFLFLALSVTCLPLLNADLERFLIRKQMGLIFCIAVIVLFIGAIGASLVFGNYHLSRDEFLAEFDASVFREGKLIAAVQPEWQSFASALSPRFMLPVVEDGGFISTYLPVNAAFRAIISLIANPNWTSPLLAACAILATFGAARRLWPSRPDAALISALLVATSSQVLMTAMTSYAMTAHLALNMIWLWLFLHDSKKGHIAALFVGFFRLGTTSTGLPSLIRGAFRLTAFDIKSPLLSFRLFRELCRNCFFLD
jgi:hypothetical protein